MNKTKISWTDASWNPVFGCSKVSEGCRFCYAETIALKFRSSQYPWTHAHAENNVVLKPYKLHEPYKLKSPSRIFVNSMSDCFHPLVPDEYIDEIFAVMRRCPQHTFQLLTKRPEGMATWAEGRDWPANVWAGTSVESRRVLHRLDALRSVPSPIRWVSAEPLLEDVGVLDLSGIHQVVVGGESGRHMADHPERWMDHAWARAIRDQCVAHGVAFYFKQSSGAHQGMGTELIEADGSTSTWHQYPDAIITMNTTVYSPSSQKVLF